MLIFILQVLLAMVLSGVALAIFFLAFEAMELFVMSPVEDWYEKLYTKIFGEIEEDDE